MDVAAAAGHELPAAAGEPAPGVLGRADGADTGGAGEAAEMVDVAAGVHAGVGVLAGDVDARGEVADGVAAAGADQRAGGAAGQGAGGGVGARAGGAGWGAVERAQHEIMMALLGVAGGREHRVG